jgi:branched-chain amino acid transport system permease protein
MTRDEAVGQLLKTQSFRPLEALPWVAALAAYFLLPQYLQLGTDILETILFALSLDLILGYTGITTLGHPAYYGFGAYTAGLLADNGWHEPLTGLLIAALGAALLGAITGAIMLRTKELALLMLGLAVTLSLGELANRLNWLTHGDDGLGFDIAPIFGQFSFDMYGKTAFLYALAVLFLAWLLVRKIVNAPFGRTLVGIRQNPARMQAIGVNVWRRKLAAFTIAAGLAGLAGGLQAQTHQFASLDVFSLELAGTVIVVLVVGGPGRLYGAFIGAPIYMIAQDSLSKDDPVFWLFWLGLFVVAMVMFFRGGALGLTDKFRKKAVLF